MSLHRLQIDGLCFTARVRESLDSVAVSLEVNMTSPFFGQCACRLELDDWLMGPAGVLDQVSAEARAAGKYVHVLDPQHIMTT